MILQSNGSELKFSDSDYDRILPYLSHQPHAVLGLHCYVDNQKFIRLYRPDATQVFIELFGKIVEMVKVHDCGIFELCVPPHTSVHDYRVYHRNGLLANDPYAFLPTFEDLDQYLFSKGVHYNLFDRMGGRLTINQGVPGGKFSVWAPNAKSVSLVGDFNFWDGRVNPMRSLGYSGVWEIFLPGLQEGEKYKFEILSQQGGLKLKADPYALLNEFRPNTASKLFPIDRFDWQDSGWMEQRKSRAHQPSPMNIYEVHLGSWKKREGQFLNYREIAEDLAKYCKEMGYTHIELLPIQEHPLDESWGYQVSGFYAATSRFGTPEDFQYFVNHLHQQNIGVLLDWVPGHFPTDDFSLSRFDGSALYEHADPRQGFHPHWHTNIFNFGRHEISNFLLANALFWIEKMHIDGLRVDAVASMLYLDYGRDEGEWIPNQYGGKENLHAIEFFKHLNSIIHDKFPGVLTIAEESTAFTGVTHSIEEGGLGFDLKWNMGWMNDSLRYFSKDMLYRHYHHHDLTFGLIYAFSERFALVLSHDEVVHGKGSLMGKMPGDLWQKFANLRLMITYMICQPGKKLLFMGGEIGQWDEWNCKQEIQWFLLNYPYHQGLHRLVKEINHFYLNHPALWEKDFCYETFQWVDFADVQNSIISYIRHGNMEKLLCVHNFTPQYHSNYHLNLYGDIQSLKEIFNSDAAEYGGSGRGNDQLHLNREGDQPHRLTLSLAPLATMIFKIN